MCKIDNPNFDDLLSVWKYSCQMMNSSILESLKVVEIVVDSPGWDWHGNEYIDWWPNEVFEKMKKTIEEQGIRGFYRWERTKVGTRTTAELLWKLRDDPEGMALTWIGASMWDKSKGLPETWRGQIYRRVTMLLNETISRLKDRGLFTWYHSSRDALPITIHDSWPLYEALSPSSYEHLVAISAVENVLTHSNWTIVRLVVGKNSD